MIKSHNMSGLHTSFDKSCTLHAQRLICSHITSSTPTDFIHTCRKAKEHGETEKQRGGGGRMWATEQPWRVPAHRAAQRMGAAKTASSADFRDSSHGCGFCSAIATRALDPPSFYLLLPLCPSCCWCTPHMCAVLSLPLCLAARGERW